MSDTTSQNSSVTSISFRFVLKWTLKAKDLDYIRNNSDAPSLRSDLYQFKTVKGLRFYLELDFTNSIFHHGFLLRVIGSPWCFELDYAFIVDKERAYELKQSKPLSFLSSYHLPSPDDEDVTIHCVVNVCPAHPASSAVEVDVSLNECQNTVDIESMPDIIYPNNYSDEMVINFIRKGDIPDFTVNKAIKIIRDTEQHKCETLRIICIEYLMQNISAHSISQISKLALDYGLTHLKKKMLATNS
ncbi:unnamed protein product [Larinioides sclopetarius]|uniref:Uncharacterized protein n=1 Tax=Larinioides sclopetarius TaxID=280406 RepID=A0AAV2AFT7_9ARAC